MRSRILFTLFLTAAVAIACLDQSWMLGGTILASPDDPISGEWSATFHAGNEVAEVTLELKLEGDKVTGKVNSEHTGPGTVSKGSWADNKLSLILEFEKHESIVVTGTLKDGKLSGEFRTEGFVSSWEARKKE